MEDPLVTIFESDMTKFKLEIYTVSKMINLSLTEINSGKKFSTSHTLTSLKRISPIFFNATTAKEIFLKISEKFKKNKFSIQQSNRENSLNLNLFYILDGEEFCNSIKFYLSKTPDELNDNLLLESERIEIKQATKEDIPLIFNFIKELADYEKSSHEVTSNEKILENSLFSDKSVPEAIICYYNDVPAGFAIYFHNFSTWTGIPGIYLDDLYVTPQF